MAVGDVYHLIDYQEMQGQQIVNLYDFEQITAYEPIGFNVADDIITGWIEGYLPSIIAVQSEQVVHTLASCGAYGSFSDFSAQTLSATGEVTGGALPSFNAWGFKLQRTTRETRHGSRRVAGVAEAWQQNGVIDTPGVTPIATLAGTFSELISVSELGIAAPVIVRLNPTTHLPSITNRIVSGLYRGITTQKSRQPGHGN